MAAHHFEAGTMCPRGLALLEGRDAADLEGKLVCHCVLLELRDRLVLIDTGLGVDDVAPTGRISAPMKASMRPIATTRTSALERVRALGFDPRDVRDIVVTHLDFDHAGGLYDFPHARVHVLRAEHEAAMARRARLGTQRYRSRQWAHGPDWRLYEPGGEPWLGFEAVRDLSGLGPDVLLVPLIGHTAGHCGVAFRDGAGWKLHAGDAYFFHGEIDPVHPRCPAGLAMFQAMMDTDREARLANQDRLRALVRDHGRDVDVFCAHDPIDLARMPALARRPRVVHASP